MSQSRNHERGFFFFLIIFNNGSLLFSLPDNMVYMIRTNSICYVRDKDKDDILNSFTDMYIYTNHGIENFKRKMVII